MPLRLGKVLAFQREGKKGMFRGEFRVVSKLVQHLLIKAACLLAMCLGAEYLL